MRVRLFGVIVALMCVAGVNAQWYCSFIGCGDKRNPSERTGICDLPVPEMFVVIYGPPPVGTGCTSNAGKVEYFSQVQRYVVDSERVIDDARAEPFVKFGLGYPVTYTLKYGDLVRESIAFPGKDWAGPSPRDYNAKVALAYPFPIMSAAQTRAVAGGACVPNPVPQMAAAYAKLNAENCK